MRTRRTFTKEFKRRLVEEILSGVATPASLCRKHNIAYPVLSRWQKQYAKGSFSMNRLPRLSSRRGSNS